MHFAGGLSGGIIIFIMSAAGALLSFERNFIEFSERDVRYVKPAENARKLKPQEIIEKLKIARPHLWC